MDNEDRREGMAERIVEMDWGLKIGHGDEKGSCGGLDQQQKVEIREKVKCRVQKEAL